MNFDPFTFLAQMINFVILLVLLQRFLYKPILEAMHRREEKIAARFQEAEEKAQEAAREAALFHEKHHGLEENRAKLLSEAAAAARLHHKRLLDDAREEVDLTRDRWFAALASEKALYLESLRQQVLKQVFSIVRRSLKDLANSTLEDQIVLVFSQRLQQLGEAEKISLVQAIQSSEGTAVVRSAFGLNERQQMSLKHLLYELFDVELQVTFEDEPGLICGLELEIYAHRISWSLYDYLDTLEQQLADLFETDGAEAFKVDKYSAPLAIAQ